MINFIFEKKSTNIELGTNYEENLGESFWK